MLESYHISLTFICIFVAFLTYFWHDLKMRHLFLHLLYCGSGVAILNLHDPFHILVALEFLAFFACIIIAFSCKDSAVKYGAINFLSGACILTALSTKSQLIFLSQAQDTFLSVGLLMHCAVFPFSGFFLNAYSRCLARDSVLLQAVSTKVALFLLFSFVGQSKLLLFSGVITVIYAIFCCLSAFNVRRLVVTNSIGQIGIVLVAISCGANVLPYIVSSILYQTILYICAFEISLLQKDLHNLKISSFYLFLPLFIATLAMSAFPGTLSFATKSIMLIDVKSVQLYTFLTLSSFLFVLFVPIRIFIKCFEINSIFKNKSLINKSSIVDGKIINSKSVCLFVLSFLLFLPLSEFEYHLNHVALQILYFCLTVFLGYALKKFLARKSILYTCQNTIGFFSVQKFFIAVNAFIIKVGVCIGRFSVFKVGFFTKKLCNTIEESPIQSTCITAIFILTFLFFATFL